MSEEKRWFDIAEGIVYTQGQTCAIKIAEGVTQTFKVERSFKLLGFNDKGQIFVAIPVTLETLKGLGFISKLKGSKKK